MVRKGAAGAMPPCYCSHDMSCNWDVKATQLCGEGHDLNIVHTHDKPPNDAERSAECVW